MNFSTSSQILEKTFSKKFFASGDTTKTEFPLKMHKHNTVSCSRLYKKIVNLSYLAALICVAYGYEWPLRIIREFRENTAMTYRIRYRLGQV